MRTLSTLLTMAALAISVTTAQAQDPHSGHDHLHGPATKKEEMIEKLLIAAQEICPVSGALLGSMGEPIKAKADEQTVFLCCKGCVGRPMKPEVWKQIQKNLAEAQGICPIKKKPLPEDPASVVVEGREIFVCCKPCTKKVKADPAKALSVVNEQLKKHVEAEKREAK